MSIQSCTNDSANEQYLIGWAEAARDVARLIRWFGGPVVRQTLDLLMGDPALPSSTPHARGYRAAVYSAFGTEAPFYGTAIPVYPLENAR